LTGIVLALTDDSFADWIYGNSLFKNIPYNLLNRSDASFYIFAAILLMLSTVVLFMVSHLLLTHLGNYFAGKTTAERFGKSGGQGTDLEHVREMFVNSGIKGDSSLFSNLGNDEYSRLA
jgi:hypothetical protein